MNETWALTYTDVLTGAGSKLAYIEKQDKLESGIVDNKIEELAIAVFDVNNLKDINDILGHDAGDEYIISSYNIIHTTFKNSPIYRIGGDEFVVIPEQDDYEHRNELMDVFNSIIDANVKAKGTLVAGGMAEFVKGEDLSYRAVFKRANNYMYERKKELKAAIK